MNAIVSQLQRKEQSEHVQNPKEKMISEDRIDAIFSRYFIWFMNNNIEEFQIFSKFYREKFLNQNFLFTQRRNLN